MRGKKVLHVLGITAVAIGLAGNADAIDVEGVFGLAPIPEDGSLAVWVPLEEGEAVSGVRWYNNDGEIAFPAILVVAGGVEWPELMSEAISVGQNVRGESDAWSEFTFSQPVASATTGLYVIFRLPENGAFESRGEHGGCGVGYRVGDGARKSWIGTSSEDWNPLCAEFQMAVEAVMARNKSGDVLVLQRPQGRNDLAEKVTEKSETLLAEIVAFPNPFNALVDIVFTLPFDSPATVEIYDIRGRTVRKMESNTLQAGENRVVWDGRDNQGAMQASGVYVARLVARDLRLTKRIALVK